MSSDELSNSGPQAWIRKVDDMQTDMSKYHMINNIEIIGIYEKWHTKVVKSTTMYLENMLYL